MWKVERRPFSLTTTRNTCTCRLEVVDLPLSSWCVCGWMRLTSISALLGGRRQTDLRAASARFYQPSARDASFAYERTDAGATRG